MMMINFMNSNAFDLIFFHLILVSLAFLLISYREKISSYLQIIDYPYNNNLKIHKLPIPRFGGIILFFYTFFALFLSSITNITSLKNLSITVIISIIYFFVGFIDDRNTLSANKKSAILISTLFLTIPLSNEFIINQINFKNLQYSINLQNGAIFFTIFSIFALYNAFNFSDGINGVAPSLGIFWIIFLIIKTSDYTNFYYQSIFISLVIILYFNIKKKIFLGNSGTNLYSILISLILIQENKNNNIFCDEIFFILFLPGIDMARLTIERILSGNSPFKGDKKHFHHLLRNLIAEKYIFLVYIFISILPIFIYNFIIQNFYLLFVFIITSYFIIITLLKKKFMLKNKKIN